MTRQQSTMQSVSSKDLHKPVAAVAEVRRRGIANVIGYGVSLRRSWKFAFLGSPVLECGHL
jgi:hypothetical protein